MGERYPPGHVAYGMDGGRDHDGKVIVTEPNLFKAIEKAQQQPGIKDCEQIANMGRDDGSKVMGVFGSPWRVVSMPNPDPFDDIENFRLSKEDAAKITKRSVSSKSLVECRLDKLETLVKRIASHLGIEE